MSPRSLRIIKHEIRVVGLDDSQFIPHSKSKVRVVGIVFRGNNWIEGAMSTLITVDGTDATENITNMIITSPHYKQLRVILLNGVTFGGFNVVDIRSLNSQTGLPVIAVTSKRPNLGEVQLALQNLPDSEKRWAAIRNAGDIFPFEPSNGKGTIYIESAGISNSLTNEILQKTTTRSKIPEPLRVAHLVASGISLNTAQL